MNRWSEIRTRQQFVILFEIIASSGMVQEVLPSEGLQVCVGRRVYASIHLRFPVITKHNMEMFKYKASKTNKQF